MKGKAKEDFEKWCNINQKFKFNDGWSYSRPCFSKGMD